MENKPQTQAGPADDQRERSLWEQLVDGIVRPPRAKYQQKQLGDKLVTFPNRFYVREDHKVVHEGKNLEVTLYLAVKKTNYIILYMHGNSSCRVQAVGLFKHLPSGVSLACFDFMGCGKNKQADTISLGVRESEQAKTVMQFLKKKGFNVILWGRSMGAATALLCGEAEFIVADSSFKSFKSLCKQVAKQHAPTVVPNFMISCFFPCVFEKLRDDVDRKANYDVLDLDIREAVKRLSPEATVVFMSGNSDKLIASRNSTKLFNECPCKNKHLKTFEGDHNSKRPDSIMIEVMGLISEHIRSKIGSEIGIATNQIVLGIE